MGSPEVHSLSGLVSLRLCAGADLGLQDPSAHPCVSAEHRVKALCWPGPKQGELLLPFLCS